MPEREQCGYVSPLGGRRCLFFAGHHSGHLTADPVEDPDCYNADGSPKLRASFEEDPDWDPEGVKAWQRSRGLLA